MKKKMKQSHDKREENLYGLLLFASFQIALLKGKQAYQKFSTWIIGELVATELVNIGY